VGNGVLKSSTVQGKTGDGDESAIRKKGQHGGDWNACTNPRVKPKPKSSPPRQSGREGGAEKEKKNATAGRGSPAKIVQKASVKKKNKKSRPGME